jgi:hypothetical protein
VSHQKKSKKVSDPSKQRDRQPMDFFRCKGRLTIAMNLDDNYADIILCHELDHVPYCCVTLPEDIREYINVSAHSTMAQVRV